MTLFLRGPGSGYAMDVPPEMQVGEPDGDGWCAWKPVNNPITEEDVRALFGTVFARIPHLFVTYMTHKCLLMTDFEVRLPQTPVNRPLAELRSYCEMYANKDTFQKRELFPFAYDGNDAGPVCFDLSVAEDRELPIVTFDWGRASDTSYRGSHSYDSFGDLLHAIEADIKAYL